LLLATYSSKVLRYSNLRDRGFKVPKPARSESFCEGQHRDSPHLTQVCREFYLRVVEYLCCESTFKDAC
jgi:hypothetical protein